METSKTSIDYHETAERCKEIINDIKMIQVEMAQVFADTKSAQFLSVFSKTDPRRNEQFNKSSEKCQSIAESIHSFLDLPVHQLNFEIA